MVSSNACLLYQSNPIPEANKLGGSNKVACPTLSGLISGKDHSYISVVSSAGEAITLTLGQYLGKNQFIDLRLTEAIFKKEDGKYLIIDFNNQIREADDY